MQRRVVIVFGAKPDDRGTQVQRIARMDGGVVALD
jgi:hypothetical protein